MILWKYINEYEQKGMVEFFSKFQGLGIIIARVNSFRVAKPLIRFNILHAVAR